MLRKFFFLVSVVLFILSCGKSEKEQNASSGLTPANGGKFYGGVFRMNESEYIKTLFPPNLTDAFSYRVACQVYEGLLKFNQSDLTLKPGIAESWTVDETGTVYTFKLRKGIKFHDDVCFPDGKGRELKASDVKYCFTFLCTQNPNNQGFHIFKDVIKGATAYFNATLFVAKPDFEIEGIKVIDDYTVQFSLEKPSSIFLYQLARSFTFVFPKEAYDKYGLEMRIHPVGTGPFYLSSIEEDISIILKRNPNYWGQDSVGNKLPFFDAISVTFIKDRKAELFEFKKGNLDMVYRLPTDNIIEIVEDAMDKTKKGEYTQYQLQRKPEMATHYLTFNNQSELFKNKNIRKAISYAIDRRKILEFVLQGEGYKAGLNGVTPPVFQNYDIEKIKGYDLNIDSAKYFLSKAGYPSGKGFPKVQLVLNSDAERNKNVAVEVQKQLKDNLNIDIELQILPFAQHIENVLNGKTDFFRIGWIADFPNPENFLYLFYGKEVPASKNDKSYPNMARYVNSAFDDFYVKGLNSKTEVEAFDNFMKAEQILMADAPVVVLWYDEGYRLLQPTVQKFPSNAMQYRDLSDVYFSQPATGVAVGK
ncbi:MAG: ABC transporter substrate-binding protein [Bacteroidota bacterium]|nr:ABC transporter substrate-binding protein [Bacteroidota bacterium]